MSTTLTSEGLASQMASGSGTHHHHPHHPTNHHAIGKRPIASLGSTLTAITAHHPHGRATDSSRNTNRYSVTQLYSMAAENDTEIEDELARAQKRLRDLKTKISSQSKKNFVLERDVRYLDSRIALLIQNSPSSSISQSTTANGIGRTGRSARTSGRG